jgi:hypothetical protein
MESPISAFIAGIDVTMAIDKTRRKLVTALAGDDKKGIRINPAPVRTIDERSN